jgi:glucokinase
MAGTGDVFLGVDIGGTKVAAGLVNDRGDILYKTRNPMNATEGPNEAVAAVRDAIDRTIHENPSATVRAIGLSAPGSVDPRTGSVVMATNVPCWKNFALAPLIASHYNLPTELHNDANAAGLAEAVWGSGTNHDCVFYATVGTGIGTAILFDRHVYLGRTGAAGEGGHMSINFDHPGPRCKCGKPGCIELLAAGPGIATRARRKIESSPNNEGKMLIDLASGDVTQISGETVEHAWRAGDPLATNILEETADLIAIWLGNIVDFLEPDVIVVGGGVGTMLSNWYPRIREHLRAWSVNPRAGEIPLVQARYGPDSGIVGAAALVVHPGRYIMHVPTH